MPDYLTLPEYAATMGISDDAAGRACRAGKIDGAQKIGKGWRIPKSAVAPQAFHLSEDDIERIAELAAEKMLTRMGRLFGGMPSV